MKGQCMKQTTTGEPPNPKALECHQKNCQDNLWLRQELRVSLCNTSVHPSQSSYFSLRSVSFLFKLSLGCISLGMPSEKKRKNFQTSVKIPTYPTLLTTFLTIFNFDKRTQKVTPSLPLSIWTHLFLVNINSTHLRWQKQTNGDNSSTK